METNQGSCGVARSMPRTLANSIVETTDTVGPGINENCQENFRKKTAPTKLYKTEVFIAFKSRKTRAFYVMVRARHYWHALLHCQGIPEVFFRKFGVGHLELLLLCERSAAGRRLHDYMLYLECSKKKVSKVLAIPTLKPHL